MGTHLALIVLVAASAAPPLEEADAWREGMLLLDEFRYEEALRRIAPLAEDDERPAAERARVLVRMGMIHADLRREDDARRCFREALALEQGATLPASASPRLEELFERARAALPAAPPTPREEAAPLPEEAPAGPAEGPPEEAASLTPLDVTSWSLAAGGTLLAVGGLAAWGGGLGLYALGEGARYQQDAAALGEAGAISQLAGQGVLVVGALALAGGALLFSVRP